MFIEAPHILINTPDNEYDFPLAEGNNPYISVRIAEAAKLHPDWTSMVVTIVKHRP